MCVYSVCVCECVWELYAKYDKIQPQSLSYSRQPVSTLHHSLFGSTRTYHTLRPPPSLPPLCQPTHFLGLFSSIRVKKTLHTQPNLVAQTEKDMNDLVFLRFIGLSNVLSLYVLHNAMNDSHA